MKKINYFGNEYKVSDKVNYVATDKDGCIWGYDVKPKAGFASFACNEPPYIDRLGEDSEVAKNWKDSLRQVKDIIVKESKLKVGDKVELLGDYYGFKKGQIVEVYKLCADGIHLFKGSNDRYSHCDGDGGAYLKKGCYKVITPTADKKTFKIRCVNNKGNSHFTTGREYDCFVVDESGYKWVNCDLSFLNPYYFGDSLDDSHGTFEMVNEHKSHPHADLILKYAMIAQHDDNPWDSFEFKNQYSDGWRRVVNPCWDSSNEYRLKPQEPKIQPGQVWTSQEGVDVEANECANGLVFTNISVGGLVIPWSFRLIQFLENFKRKE